MKCTRTAPALLSLSSLASCLISAAHPACADVPTKAEEAESPTLTEVVVTATRYEEEIRSIPANVSVITAEDIANSTAKDVPEILGQEVGIHVYDISGNRRNYRVDRSGFGETAQLNTLLLVDGRRINSPDLSGPDWSLIPLERVERIEIVRGSRGSVLYGDNATDSVINIITKRGSPGVEFGLKSAGGQWDTFEQTGYLRGATDDLNYSLTGRYYNTDGYRDNSGSKQYDAGVNLDYYLGDRATIAFGSGYHKDDTERPGALRQSAIDAGADREDTLNPDDFGDTKDYYAQLTPEIFLLENSSFKTPISYRFRETDFFSSFAAGEFTGDTETNFVNASPQFVISNLNFFRLDTDDEIFFNPATFLNENLPEETRRQGVEVSLDYDTRPISVTGTFTYRDTKIRGGALSGNKVPNVPRLQGSLDVVWRPLQGLSLTFTGLYVGKRHFESDFANSFEKQDNYYALNAKAKYNWSEATLFLDLNNILNKKGSQWSRS